MYRTKAGITTHLTGFKELDVVSPHITALLILTDMIESKLICRTDDLSRSWPSVDSPVDSVLEYVSRSICRADQGRALEVEHR